MRKMFSQKQIEKMINEITNANLTAFDGFLYANGGELDFIDDIWDVLVNSTNTNDNYENKVLGFDDAGDPIPVEVSGGQTLSEYLESKFPSNYQGVLLKTSVNDFIGKLKVIYKENGIYKIGELGQSENDTTIYAYLNLTSDEIPVHDAESSAEINHTPIEEIELDKQNLLSYPMYSYSSTKQWNIPLEDIYMMYT